MKKVLVACGTGMSTSTMIAQKLQDYLASEGILVATSQCCLNEIPLNSHGVDLIITAMKTDTDYGVPTLNGAALLTGVNDDALKQKLKRCYHNKPHR
ncbi:PTS sugar transporter subunit IIB SgcB [Providencia stuartii]|uniref:PTS system enzymeIIB component n=1 Tax=Providencia stuartii (strain MRSN 2154) TaxID=1157951 RepID=A0A140NTW1_PROSM|nr:PTS sugar transporter subunit IIB SgcB [Providencia stuartii]AFH95392.1 putative PTS system enzymeIIB component [Providencia stuartii MRSN 2154]